ncbi:hypothetical protein THOB06_160073 [Vibrio rotiferianus]|nr:hypothetical protein THOG10_160073 [Vibrio rotiferianus]CAH1567902.1 hypothetical protein THOB06_160073 [Vibrio rotiferianus]
MSHFLEACWRIIDDYIIKTIDTVLEINAFREGNRRQSSRVGGLSALTPR